MTVSTGAVAVAQARHGLTVTGWSLGALHVATYTPDLSEHLEANRLTAVWQ
jgi:hypothetical protein